MTMLAAALALAAPGMALAQGHQRHTEAAPTAPEADSGGPQGGMMHGGMMGEGMMGEGMMGEGPMSPEMQEAMRARMHEHMQEVMRPMLREIMREVMAEIDGERRGQVPGAAGDGHVHEAAPSGSPATDAYRASNIAMHEAMDIEFTDDADVDFARGMIGHHQGAIDMARIVLEHGRDEELRQLAEEIIAAQEAEIAFLRGWLAARGE